MKSSDFTGTGTLLELFLRQDRFLLPIWVLFPVILVFVTATTFIAMSGDGMESVLGEFNSDPLISSLLGPAMSMDLPGAIVWRGVSQLALTLGLGSLLTVIRHTRADEKAGRSELVRAYVVGSYAGLTAALTLAGMGNLISGVLIAFSIIALGGAPAGSFLFGAAMCIAGLFFAGIGALGVQLRENSGTARGIGAAALGLGLVTAILNNFGGGHTLLMWITPMAWQRLIRPFAGNQGRSLLYCIFFAAVPIAVSYALSTRRDIGAGVLSAKPGPPEAAPGLSSTLALAWRMHKKSFISWLTGTELYIIVFAAISPGLSHKGGMSDWLTSLGGTGWADDVGLGYVFISVAIYLISLFVAVYSITAVLRLKKEETEGRAEMLMDKQVSRTKWMCGHLVMAFLCSAALLVFMGIAGGLSYGIAAGDLNKNFWNVFIMSVSKIPPVWILTAATAMLYGLWPRAASLGWVLWTAPVILELIWEGRIIGWSLMRISPFSYVHYTIDVANLPLFSLFCMICISAALAVLGLFGFRNRDVMTKA